MNKVLIIQGEELSYVAKVNENTIELNYADSDVWASHVKGTQAAKLKDTGDGVKIKFEDGTKLNLDYGQFVELYHLLDAKMEIDDKMVNEITYIDIE